MRYVSKIDLKHVTPRTIGNLCKAIDHTTELLHFKVNNSNKNNDNNYDSGYSRSLVLLNDMTESAMLRCCLASILLLPALGPELKA